MKLTMRESEILVEAGLNGIKNSKRMASQILNDDLFKEIQETHQKEMMTMKAEMLAIEKTNRMMSEREQGFYLKQIEANKQCLPCLSFYKIKPELEPSQREIDYSKRLSNTILHQPTQLSGTDHLKER